MAVRFVSVDHDTPMLLPPDLRDWVPADHIVHFVMDAVKLLDLTSAKINHRGTGSAQYPPSMMLGLLIYSYATGTFSSRKIEKLTYENLAVRFLTGDTHPDHDSICTFRRENKELLENAFHRILQCAALTQILKVGDITVAIDGTKILANASKHGAVSHGHAIEQMKLLEDQIAELLAKAEDADSAPLQDGLSIPAEIARREDRIEKLKQATAIIEDRAAERSHQETEIYRQKLEDRARKQRETGHKPRGKAPAPPKQEPSSKDQYNFTDPESRIMKTGGGFQQCYNAQAAVEVESRLIVGGYVTDAPNDKQQLIPVLGSISSAAGKIGTTLVDSGYYSAAAPKLPSNPESDAPAATARTKTDQSFGDIKNLLDKLIAALGRVSGYDTGAPVDITIASLRSLATQLDGLNQMVAGKEQALAAARGPRNAAYDIDLPGSPCLRTRMLAAKEATKSQFGTASAEYAQVKGIKV
jgi:transposase